MTWSLRPAQPADIEPLADLRAEVMRADLTPHHQGQGLGSSILEATLAHAPHATVSLIVLQGSPARRLYERHGFRYESEDPIDVTMTRQPL